MRALLSIDAPRVAHRIFEILKSTKVVVDQTDSGEETLDLARHYEYDIILLEMRLSDIEGFEVLRRLRSRGIEIPVIMLSHVARASDNAKAFTLGADDVMTIPFDETELLARIWAVIRRNKGFSQSALEVGPLTVHLDRHEVLVEGRPVHFTGKEYAFLELLMLRKGIAVSKDAVLNHLYGGMEEPGVKIVDVFVSRIRRKLAEAGADGMIGTIWGRGFVLRAPSSNLPARAEQRQPTLS